jgi:hypothetical protein
MDVSSGLMSLLQSIVYQGWFSTIIECVIGYIIKRSLTQLLMQV